MHLERHRRTAVFARSPQRLSNPVSTPKRHRCTEAPTVPVFWSPVPAPRPCGGRRTRRTREGPWAHSLLVLEAGAANRVRLAEGGGGALRVALDEKGDEEDNRDEGAEDDCKERTEGHLEANRATINSDDTRKRRGQLLNSRDLQRHLRRGGDLRRGDLAAGAQHRRGRKGLDGRSNERKRKEETSHLAVL